MTAQVEDLLTLADSQLARLAEEDEELRKMSPSDLQASSTSDYGSMLLMHQQVLELANRVRESAYNPDGSINNNNTKTYDKLVNTAVKARSELNRMRNHDRATTLIVKEHCSELLQSVVAQLGNEFRKIIEAIEKGQAPQATSLSLKRLINSTLPPLFNTIQRETLNSTVEKHNLPPY